MSSGPNPPAGEPVVEGPRRQGKADYLFAETREIAHTRCFRKWRSMKGRNLARFYEENRNTFLRRMGRGVPQRFRWEAWKVVMNLQSLLDSENAEFVLELSPFSIEPADCEDRPAEDPEKCCDAPDRTVSVDDPFGRAVLRKMATEMTPKAFYEELTTRHSRFHGLIEIDVVRTFPEITVFGGMAQSSLHRLLNAYSNFAPHVGYCQGMNFVLGFILLVSDMAPEHELFYFFCVLMQKYHLHGFFREGFPLLAVYLKNFDHLCEYYIPELRKHFISEGVLPPVYLHQWFLTLFITSLPLGTVVVLWDYMLCTGLHALLPITISLLKILQSFLLRLKFEGIVKFLKSLRSSGDCDESKIGKMLLKQAEPYLLTERCRESLINIDFGAILREAALEASVDARRVDLDDLLPAGDSGGDNPLKTAMGEQDLQDDDDDDEPISTIKEPGDSPIPAPADVGSKGKPSRWSAGVSTAGNLLGLRPKHRGSQDVGVAKPKGDHDEDSIEGKSKRLRPRVYGKKS